MARDSDGVDVMTMGCMERADSARLSCRVGSQRYVAIACCSNASFCNRHLLPRYATAHHLTNDHSAAAAPASAHGESVSQSHLDLDIDSRFDQHTVHCRFKVVCLQDKHLGQVSLASLRGRLIEYQLQLG